MPTYRSDQFLIHVNVEGITIDNEPWELFEGGEKKAQSLKQFPGGMADQVELGNTPEREQIKLARKWSDVLINAFKALDNASGHTPMEVSVTTLGANKKPTGNTDTYTGILLETKRPTYKAGPAEVAMLELTMGPHGPIQ